MSENIVQNMIAGLQQIGNEQQELTNQIDSLKKSNSELETALATKEQMLVTGQKRLDDLQNQLNSANANYSEAQQKLQAISQIIGGNFDAQSVAPVQVQAPNDPNQDVPDVKSPTVQSIADSSSESQQSATPEIESPVNPTESETPEVTEPVTPVQSEPETPVLPTSEVNENDPFYVDPNKVDMDKLGKDLDLGTEKKVEEVQSENASVESTPEVQPETPSKADELEKNFNGMTAEELVAQVPDDPENPSPVADKDDPFAGGGLADLVKGLIQ